MNCSVYAILIVIAAMSRISVAVEQWEYIDNGTVRVGVDRSRGACIGFFSESGTKRNLLNHFDEGRFIQQSYYGAPDGSVMMKKPWTYNPVQGGSGRGKPARLLEFTSEPDRLYAKIEPRNWPGGDFCPDSIMEETISLSGAVARIHFSMKFTGEPQGGPRPQEMPAVFVDAALANLVYIQDGKLTRRVPGWPNERGEATENWVAWLDDSDWGIGILTPGTTRFACYRFGAGKTGPNVSRCSYVAPVRTFALEPGLLVEYDVYLTIGSLSDIRTRFEAINH